MVGAAHAALRRFQQGVGEGTDQGRGPLFLGQLQDLLQRLAQLFRWGCASQFVFRVVSHTASRVVSRVVEIAKSPHNGGLGLLHSGLFHRFGEDGAFGAAWTALAHIELKLPAMFCRFGVTPKLQRADFGQSHGQLYRQPARFSLRPKRNTVWIGGSSVT